MVIVNLKQLMIRKGAVEGRRISYKDIENVTGIGVSTLSRIANIPGYNIKKEYIEKLCKYFDVPPDELMTILPDPRETRSP